MKMLHNYYVQNMVKKYSKLKGNGKLHMHIKNDFVSAYDKNIIRSMSNYECEEIPFLERLNFKDKTTYLYGGYFLYALDVYPMGTWIVLKPSTDYLIRQISDMLEQGVKEITITNFECDKNHEQQEILIDFIISIIKKYNVEINIYTESEIVVNRVGRHIIEKNISCDNVDIMLPTCEKTYFDDEGDIIDYPLGTFGTLELMIDYL